jgi:hypothetical protein
MEFAQAFFFVAAGHNDGQKHSAGARHPVLDLHESTARPAMGLVRLAAADNR